MAGRPQGLTPRSALSACEPSAGVTLAQIAAAGLAMATHPLILLQPAAPAVAQPSAATAALLAALHGRCVCAQLTDLGCSATFSLDTKRLLVI